MSSQTRDSCVCVLQVIKVSAVSQVSVAMVTTNNKEINYINTRQVFLETFSALKARVDEKIKWWMTKLAKRLT